MLPKNLLGMLFILMLVAAACAPSATEAPAMTEPPAQEATSTQAPAMTDTPAAETPAAETPAATGTEAAGGTGTGTAAVPVTGEATVNVAQDATHGDILVNGEGFSLYVFTDDVQNSGTSACTGDCAVEWPPLVSQGAPVAGPGVDAALIGTITRDDGSMQVTYNGWPLYRFEDDLAPGDVLGQGMEGKWFLISPAGTAIQ